MCSVHGGGSYIQGMSRDGLIGGYNEVEGGSTDKCASKTEVHRVDIRTKVMTYI